MLAAVFKKRGVLGIEDRPEPAELAEDEVLLEVEGCGVCGTDLHILSDPPGHPATEGVILGHEIVARIVDQGVKVREFDIGTRVLVDANLKCGICPLAEKASSIIAKTGPRLAFSWTVALLESSKRRRKHFIRSATMFH